MIYTRIVTLVHHWWVILIYSSFELYSSSYFVQICPSLCHTYPTHLIRYLTTRLKQQTDMTCLKLGYRDSDSPDIDRLFTDSDEQFFDRIKHNSRHILQQYLPDRPDLNYSLYSRHHNKTLIWKTSELNDRDFMIRNLYKYSY